MNRSVHEQQSNRYCRYLSLASNSRSYLLLSLDNIPRRESKRDRTSMFTSIEISSPSRKKQYALLYAFLTFFHGFLGGISAESVTYLISIVEIVKNWTKYGGSDNISVRDSAEFAPLSSPQIIQLV